MTKYEVRATDRGSYYVYEGNRGQVSPLFRTHKEAIRAMNKEIERERS